MRTSTVTDFDLFLFFERVLIVGLKFGLAAGRKLLARLSFEFVLGVRLLARA